MKRAVVRAGWLGVTCAWSAVVAAAPCAPPPAVWTERFMSAACTACWAARDAPVGAVLDWIVPAADDAPLSAAALVEAGQRAPGLPKDRALERQWWLPSPAPVALRVVDGLAFNGYVGLQLEVARTGRTVANSVGYMALVERVAAGQDGATIDRRLVRAVVGPLSLGELATRRRVRHLAAVRLPDSARADRLGAVAWVERADGKVLAFVESAPDRCSGGSLRPE